MVLELVCKQLELIKHCCHLDSINTSLKSDNNMSQTGAGITLCGGLRMIWKWAVALDADELLFEESTVIIMDLGQPLSLFIEKRKCCLLAIFIIEHFCPSQ